MAIKVYKGGVSRGGIAPGTDGVNGWFKAASPGNIMHLIRVQIMFNSYNVATNEWDNPINDRFNYFNTMIDNTGLGNPFISMSGTPALGNAENNPDMFFNTPGVYETNLFFQNEIWMAYFTYNYAAAGNRAHWLQVFFYVDEKPV